MEPINPSKLQASNKPVIKSQHKNAESRSAPSSELNNQPINPSKLQTSAKPVIVAASSVPIPDVNMREKILKELQSVQHLQDEYSHLNLQLSLKLTDPVQKEKRKQTLEYLKIMVNQFVTAVVQDSETRNLEDLEEEVKNLKRMTEQYLFGVKKEIEKIERKQKKIDDKSKKKK